MAAYEIKKNKEENKGDCKSSQTKDGVIKAKIAFSFFFII